MLGKKYLSEYDLCIDLFNKFDLNVIDVVPVRNVYMASTDKGNKILKKVEYTIEELKYIDDLLNYIRNKFDRVISFVRNKDGKIYTIWNGDMYCIMDVVQGSECNFSNPVDISIAARALGEMHAASEGFKTSLSNKYNNGKLIDDFKRRVQEMDFFKSIAMSHERKNEFDEMFLKNEEYYIDEIKNCVSLLEDSCYYKLCSEEDKVVVCHHDLAHHNILIRNEKAYFIDFDYAIIDLKIHDLCNFISKVIKNFCFDINKADTIIENYCITNSLNKRELEVLYAMFTFPEDFYSICKDYYTRRKDWGEDIFLSRFKKKILYKEDREEFLRNFRKLI
ncbi:CotS family spore coat protein [Clostridium fermenticellae]|uniref:CotS family spore coat protein n=1 Tax=Clostridium fermenticellae TaxID=2068654 RepID=A0A386H0J9_9CLOT|nr:CotS family spore coat protein [Clostridium fermenticellae]AYD39166.1 CotS family spore coat protein [Clostridium fermenticellae]